MGLFYVGTPDDEYRFETNCLFSKLEEMEDKQEVKYHILKTFLSVVITKKELDNF